MGIPAYYKKLSSTVKGLIARGHPYAAIQWLFMDFNCLVYHCLPKMPPYQQVNHEAWEAELIDCVVRYTKRVVGLVAPEEGVLIAVDGVVPMAKMRQQRLRRFKSVWEKAHGVGEKARGMGNSAADHWNSNSITPGTAFMGKLRRGLESVKGAGWTISSSDEPGEGEHKIMAAWRSGAYDGNFAVYGLDADLVVLSLLGRELRKARGEEGQIWLFREEISAGTIQYDEAGAELFEWFSIHALAEWIHTRPQDQSGSSQSTSSRPLRNAIYDYCFAMSVLGNDFLPSSLGMKMRDEGHRILLETLDAVPCLVDPATLEPSKEGMSRLFQHLARIEERHVRGALLKKKRLSDQLKARGTPPRVGDSDWPLITMEEKCILDERGLARDWRRRYARRFFDGHAPARIAREYLYGIQWVWAYYTGGEVCYNWYYPHGLPPLWDWIRRELESGVPAYPGSIVLRATDIRPVEQLALVLPLESWDLIPLSAKAERDFPRRAPQYFPTTYGFDSVGKRFFWECEPLIPMPSMRELKRICAL